MLTSWHRNTGGMICFNLRATRRLTLFVVLSSYCWQADAVRAEIVNIDPSRTYLHTNFEQPGGSIPIGLSELQITAGTSPDVDGNGVPDECNTTPSDLDGDGDVDAPDLAILFAKWG